MTCRVLLIDNNELNAKKNQELFISLACDVHIAKTAKEALSLLKAKSIHLVFSSLELEDSSGYELARKVKSNYPILSFTCMTENIRDQLNIALDYPVDNIVEKVIKKESAINVLEKNGFVPRSACKALLFDSDLKSLKRCKTIFEKAGCQTTLANSEDLTMDYLKRNHEGCDVVYLGHFHGAYNLAKKIKKLFPEILIFSSELNYCGPDGRWSAPFSWVLEEPLSVNALKLFLSDHELIHSYNEESSFDETKGFVESLISAFQSK